MGSSLLCHIVVVLRPPPKKAIHRGRGGGGANGHCALRFKIVSMGARREQDSGTQMRKSQSLSCSTDFTALGHRPSNNNEFHRV